VCTFRGAFVSIVLGCAWLLTCKYAGASIVSDGGDAGDVLSNVVEEKPLVQFQRQAVQLHDTAAVAEDGDVSSDRCVGEGGEGSAE
jgi:hypothetical protein